MIKKIILFLSLFLFSIFSFYSPVNGVDDLTSKHFMIDVWDLAPGGEKLGKSTAAQTWVNVLETFITKLMIAFWVLALLVMTIGWWYMIFYHGKDDLLSKWKTIFTAWLIALVVALSAWILVEVVVYILY